MRFFSVVCQLVKLDTPGIALHVLGYVPLCTVCSETCRQCGIRWLAIPVVMPELCHKSCCIPLYNVVPIKCHC